MLSFRDNAKVIHLPLARRWSRNLFYRSDNCFLQLSYSAVRGLLHSKLRILFLQIHEWFTTVLQTRLSDANIQRECSPFSNTNVVLELCRHVSIDHLKDTDNRLLGCISNEIWRFAESVPSRGHEDYFCTVLSAACCSLQQNCCTDCNWSSEIFFSL